MSSPKNLVLQSRLRGQALFLQVVDPSKRCQRTYVTVRVWPQSGSVTLVSMLWNSATCKAVLRFARVYFYARRFYKRQFNCFYFFFLFSLAISSSSAFICVIFFPFSMDKTAKSPAIVKFSSNLNSSRVDAGVNNPLERINNNT